MALSGLHILVRSPDEPSSTTSYEFFRNEEIKRSENDPLRVFGIDRNIRLDQKGQRLAGGQQRLTIGYGYDITARSASTVAATISPFLSPGIVISAAQIEILEAYRTNRVVNLPGHALNGSIPTTQQVRNEWANIELASPSIRVGPAQPADLGR